jgi:hypothetical protein
MGRWANYRRRSRSRLLAPDGSGNRSAELLGGGDNGRVVGIPNGDGGRIRNRIRIDTGFDSGDWVRHIDSRARGEFRFG